MAWNCPCLLRRHDYQQALHGAAVVHGSNLNMGDIETPARTKLIGVQSPLVTSLYHCCAACSLFLVVFSCLFDVFSRNKQQNWIWLTTDTLFRGCPRPKQQNFEEVVLAALPKINFLTHRRSCMKNELGIPNSPLFTNHKNHRINNPHFFGHCHLNGGSMLINQPSLGGKITSYLWLKWCWFIDMNLLQLLNIVNIKRDNFLNNQLQLLNNLTSQQSTNFSTKISPPTPGTPPPTSHRLGRFGIPQLLRRFAQLYNDPDEALRKSLGAMRNGGELVNYRRSTKNRLGLM